MCASVYADLIGAMTLHLMRNTAQGDVRVKDGLARKLDVEPNRYMTRQALVSLIVWTLLLDGAGNQVTYPKFTPDGLLDELVPLKPSRLSFMANGNSYLIPDNVLPLIRENIDKFSKLISKVYFKAVKGTARQNIAGSIPEAVWTEMKGKINEIGLSFSQVEVDGYKVAGYIPINNSLLEDSDLSLATEILTAIGQAIGYALDKAIVYGTGIKMPLGIVTRLAQTAEPDGYGENARQWVDLHTKNILAVRGGTAGSYTQLTGIELFKGIAKATKVAKGKYSRGVKVWLMNESTHQTINIEAMSINASGAIVSGIQNTMPVIGGEIIELDFIPEGDIVFGYADVYLLAERKGIQLAMSEHVLFLEDITLYKGTARYDGQPVIAESFAAIAIGGGTPTTSVTFVADTANV